MTKFLAGLLAGLLVAPLFYHLLTDWLTEREERRRPRAYWTRARIREDMERRRGPTYWGRDLTERPLRARPRD